MYDGGLWVPVGFRVDAEPSSGFAKPLTIVGDLRICGLVPALPGAGNFDKPGRGRMDPLLPGPVALVEDSLIVDHVGAQRRSQDKFPELNRPHSCVWTLAQLGSLTTEWGSTGPRPDTGPVQQPMSQPPPVNAPKQSTSIPRNALQQSTSRQ